jgi:hypothetical protein
MWFGVDRYALVAMLAALCLAGTAVWELGMSDGVCSVSMGQPAAQSCQ